MRFNLIPLALLLIASRSSAEDYYATAYSQASGRVDLTGTGSKPLVRIDSTSKAIELTATWSVSINDVRYDAVGSSNTTSGASLIGVYDELAGSNGTRSRGVKRRP